jgi:hypothetical protein
MKNFTGIEMTMLLSEGFRRITMEPSKIEIKINIFLSKC